MDVPPEFSEQVKLFKDILLTNPEIRQVLSVMKYVNLPECYLGAGAVAQTIWNHLNNIHV